MAQRTKAEALGGIAHSVVHDLNNLLAVIQNHASAARRKDSPHGYRAAVQRIERAARCAGELTKSFMALGRECDEPVRRRIDLNLEIKRLMPILEVMVKHRAFGTIRFLPMLELCMTMADPNNVAQLLLNAVANAADAIDEGGDIVVWTESVQLDGAEGRPAGNFVCIRVCDSGSGMTADEVERIFEVGYSTKGSTGAGMATIKRVVELDDGFTTIESSPGKGTTVSAYFPCCARARSAA